MAKKAHAKDDPRALVAKGTPVLYEGRVVENAFDLPEDAKSVEPVRDEHGKLTYAAMEATINQGGSVLVGDAVVSNLDDLPSEEELAKGDADRERQLASAFDAQIAELTARKSRLMAASGTRTTTHEKKKD
jgi:hypothetical protein